MIETRQSQTYLVHQHLALVDMTAKPALFQPYQVGDILLQHRVVMAPLSRIRANEKGEVGEIVVQLARDPVEGGLRRPVGDVVDVEQAADLDAADHGGDGDEFGGRAGLEDGPNRLEEHQGADAVDLGGR